MRTPKEIRAETDRLLGEIKEISDNRPTHYGSDVQTLSRFAQLLSLGAEQQAQSAEKLERQTETLITLTRSLKIYTVLLFILTGVLVGIEAFHFFERREAPIQPAPHTGQTNQANQKAAHD